MGLRRALTTDFLVHLSRRLKCTIVIMHCPSSVRPSSVVVNFSHFQLLLWNCLTEFNETWHEARSQHPPPSLCFSGRSEKQDGRPGLWLAETFSTSPLKLLNGIQRNLIGSKISMSFTKFVFSGLSVNKNVSLSKFLKKGGTLFSGARYVALGASCYSTTIWDIHEDYLLQIGKVIAFCNGIIYYGTPCT